MDLERFLAVGFATGAVTEGMRGGGVGIGYSTHAGVVIVADGTEEAGQRIQRVLTSDPAMGVLRHVDAGYDEAIAVASSTDIDIPM